VEAFRSSARKRNRKLDKRTLSKFRKYEQVTTNFIQEEQERLSATEALGAIGDPRAVDVLLLVLSDHTQYTSVRISAADALGAIGDPKAIDKLIGVLINQQESETVRRSTANAL